MPCGRRRGADREPGAATLADVAYDDADPVAHWVADGYSTIFAEAAEQADVPFDVVLCQIGVGSFASAAVRFACHQSAARRSRSASSPRPPPASWPRSPPAGRSSSTRRARAWPG